MRNIFMTIDGAIFNNLQSANEHESKLILDRHFKVAIFLENNKLHNVFVDLVVFKEKYVTIENFKRLPKELVSTENREINRIDSKPLPQKSDLLEITYYNDYFDAKIETYEYVKGVENQVRELVKDFALARNLTFLD